MFVNRELLCCCLLVAVVCLLTESCCVVTCEYYVTVVSVHLSPPIRLPMPRPGEVLGLVGTNGIGKSTALKILAGKQKPNLGRFDVCFVT